MSLVENTVVQPTIASALQSASKRTGVEFDYLLKTAMRESSLDCQAKSRTSSACGLFQFTEQSWLGTMKKHGAALGLGTEAAAIEQSVKQILTCSFLLKMLPKGRKFLPCAMTRMWPR